MENLKIKKAGVVSGMMVSLFLLGSSSAIAASDAQQSSGNMHMQNQQRMHHAPMYRGGHHRYAQRHHYRRFCYRGDCGVRPCGFRPCGFRPCGFQPCGYRPCANPCGYRPIVDRCVNPCYRPRPACGGCFGGGLFRGGFGGCGGCGVAVRPMPNPCFWGGGCNKAVGFGGTMCSNRCWRTPVGGISCGCF